MPLDCRLILDEPADGAWNMAVDEALFESATAGGRATLRFYQWGEPTLSLGYFQPYADRARHAASSALPCVRRSSGGGALIHDRELTYSLMLPPNALPGRDTRAMYCDAHRAVIEAVRDLAPADLAPEADGADRLILCDPEAEKLPASEEPFLCFLRRADGDLLVDGPHPRVMAAPGVHGRYKVGGSAQRKRHGALLQHGGILLAESPQAAELPGLAELGVLQVTPSVLADVLSLKFSERLDLRLDPASLTEAENRLATEMRKTKHASLDWVKRR